MFVKSLELENYRNYKELNMEFDKNTNILYGDNAQGKTNILESIYVCGTTKSHRTNKDKELINFDELLSFGEEDTVVTVLVLIELYQNKDKYSFSRTFNDNLTVILKPHQGSLSMTKEGKEKTIRWIKKLDDAGKLIPLIKQSISFFEEIYNNEVKK